MRLTELVCVQFGDFDHVGSHHFSFDSAYERLRFVEIFWTGMVGGKEWVFRSVYGLKLASLRFGDSS